MRSCRGVLFQKRQFAAEIIVTCVRWYLRFSLSLRDVEQLMAERWCRKKEGALVIEAHGRNMDTIDPKYLIAKVAARHGVKIDARDPVMAIRRTLRGSVPAALRMSGSRSCFGRAMRKYSRSTRR
jgi:hypothetical protein